MVGIMKYFKDTLKVNNGGSEIFEDLLKENYFDQVYMVVLK